MEDAATTDLIARIRHSIDTKTKPLGALGRIEDLAAQIAIIQGTVRPRAETCTLTIFAADHGVVAQGVSAFPQEVTVQMLGNFLSGGAAATVFARTLNVAVRIVDAGVIGTPPEHPDLISRRIGSGTQDFSAGPAMTADGAARALEAGRALGSESPGEVAAFGEMGIGNTSSAAMLAHKLTGLGLDALTGRGTGLDDAGLRRKRTVLETASGRTSVELSPDAALLEYGGFEIAMMAGAVIGAAQAGKVVLIDGFIATSAALVAGLLDPGCRGALVYSHVSEEAGHRPILDWLEARPLLALDMRLGEGTGALLAWPLVRVAAAMLCDMASFDDAGVRERT